MDKYTSDEAILKKLDAILSVMQDLFILECAKMGFKKDTVRTMLRVDNSRIGRTWKHAKPARGEPSAR
jgi:hypothetical protein